MRQQPELDLFLTFQAVQNRQHVIRILVAFLHGSGRQRLNSSAEYVRQILRALSIGH